MQGEALVICDKGKSVNPLLLHQQLEAAYHNCHLKPSPPSDWVSYHHQSIWWPLLFLIILLIICTNQTFKQKAFSNQRDISRTRYWGMQTRRCLGWNCISGSEDMMITWERAEKGPQIPWEGAADLSYNNLKNISPLMTTGFQSRSWLGPNTKECDARSISCHASTMVEVSRGCGCVCAGWCTCGGCICGHQNSLGPARRSGLCQSLKLDRNCVGGLWWCTLVAQFIWCGGAWSSAAAWCNAPRAAAAYERYDAGPLDNLPGVDQERRRHHLEA